MHYLQRFTRSHLLCILSASDTSLDVHGNLEGERIVGEAIQGIPNLWCSEEHPASHWQSALSPNPNNTSLTVTQITSAQGTLVRDWRKPIHRMLESQDVNIRITDKPPQSKSQFRKRTDVTPVEPGRPGPVRARATTSRLAKPGGLAGGTPLSKLR